MQVNDVQFKVGDKAVYPAQGVAEVIEIEEKDIAGNRQAFYVLRILDTDRKIMVPVKNADAVGLRQVISEQEILEIFDILRERTIAFDNQTWNRRYRGFMDKIKTGKLRFLVATDVAARGIDISDLTHVISYATPDSPEVYVHRTGRTGRAGKAGVAISLVSGLDIGNFQHLQHVNKISITERSIPYSLGRLAAEDPSFRVSSDHDSGQTIIKGMGELHLDILVDRMKREFKVEANVGAPQVAYRETITSEADIDYTHKKQSGGAGQFARVKMIIKPGEPGCGLNFENTVVGGNIPKEYIPGVEKGIAAAMTFGVVAGFPVTDVHVVLYDGAYHDVDSSVMAFELAGRAGFREGLQKAGPKLLEPVMRVEVITPEDFVGDVIGDLNSRRGQVQGMEPQGVATLIKAMVPLATMFGYVNNLRSLTQGRANYSMFFERYEQCPEMIADEVKKKMA